MGRSKEVAMNRASWIAVALSMGLSIVAITTLVTAGPLDPPTGTVTSTYKTLAEVEPRIAINSTNTPGDNNSLFRITQPGSYYLTGNITGVAGKHGIEIDSDGVTLDLGGFELRGVAGMGPFDGVSTARNALRNIAVVNGSLRNWGGDGVDLESFFMNNGRVEAITAAGNAGAGIRAGARSTVLQCSAFANGDAGIDAQFGTTVAHCAATNNTGAGISALPGGCTVVQCSTEGNGGNGISVGSGSTVLGCTARLNLGRGIEASAGCTVTDCAASDNNGVGIAAADSCTLADCTANSNDAAGLIAGNSCSITNCTSSGNGTSGIAVSDGCTIANCTVNNNTGTGILANNGCRIAGNMVRNNQQDGVRVNFSCVVADNNCNGDGAAAGTHGAITVIGQGNRVEGNNISYADRGLYITAGGNTVFRNCLKSCTVNFEIAVGNDVGPIGSTSTATSPWANIQY